jgi:exonuclease III
MIDALDSTITPILTLLPKACKVTQFGDTINYKDSEDTRIATQNIGRYVGKTRWSYILRQCNQKMKDNHIDILTLQETHLAADASIIPMIKAEAAELGLTINFGGCLTDKITTRSGGVAIITPRSWSLQDKVMPATKTLPERVLTLLVPLNEKHRTDTHIDPSLMAISSIYGFSGHTSRITTTQKTQASILTQKVRESHNWLLQHTDISIIGTDCNLLMDPNIDTHHKAQDPKVYEEAFLSTCLMELGYQDAMRTRYPLQPIKTYHPTHDEHTNLPSMIYSNQEPDNKDTGSYLDRILVKGAEITRAGCVHPDQWPELGRLDHSLVYADIKVRTMPAIQTPMKVRGQPSATELLKLATEMNTTNDQQPFIDFLTSRIPQVCYNKAIDVTNMINSFTTPINFGIIEERIENALTEYLQNIYQPIIDAALTKQTAMSTHAKQAETRIPSRKQVLENKKNRALASLEVACNMSWDSNTEYTIWDKYTQQPVHIKQPTIGLINTILTESWCTLNALYRPDQFDRSVCPTLATIQELLNPEEE